MRIVFYYSRQDAKLARAEVLALLKGKIVEDKKEYLIAEIRSFPFNRLVMTRFAGKLLQDVMSIKKVKLGFSCFAVRVSKTKKTRARTKELEKRVGLYIDGKVDLENPKTVVRVIADGKRLLVCEELYEFSAKKVNIRNVGARPFFHPTSLQPVLARLLVNLSGATKSVLDPLCGVGGILLEAADIGLRTQGVEIDERYAKGAEENLWFYDLKAKVDCADFLKWKGKQFEAVVTDLPYGISSGLFGKTKGELYEKAFEKLHSHSKKLVVMAGQDISRLLKKTGWKVEQKFKVYVHKGLTRRIYICSA